MKRHQGVPMHSQRTYLVASTVLAAVLGCAGAARAQTVNVTHGFVDGRQGNYNAPVWIAGERGFTFSTLLNFRDKFTGPQSCNDDPGHCTTGSTLSLHTTTNFSGGTATLDGR